jgi:hypothetical protein
MILFKWKLKSLSTKQKSVIGSFLHKFKQEKILPSLPIFPIQAQNGIVENKPLQMLICERWIIFKNSIMAACCLGKMTKSTIEWLLTLLLDLALKKLLYVDTKLNKCCSVRKLVMWHFFYTL